MTSRGWERDGEDLAPRDNNTATAAEINGAAGSLDAGGDVGTAAAASVPTKRRRNLLRESHLVSAEGLKKVYRTFPYQVSADVSGREAQALASLVKMYKQWAFDLYPGLNLEDFVERAETLGKSHQVQGLMADLRDKEKLKNLRKRPREDEEEEEKDKSSDSDGEEAML
ncbi:TIMELESS-interacting protein [Phytophthora cinnamomi]|uniref:TIMELESS-interacting protein n=1 Tax=Phytophthora cinnamomi TaxID=4785 RepID=UPI00355AC016|nr:TIMELESS-interacting protein [Phytophthora cinnamomi]KAG6587166.1 TIMELESS-interacting protein [Phytophthora cinnamomi]